MSEHPTDNPAAFDAQVQFYKRTFQRALRHRPTDLQRRLMENAAYTQCQYEKAARDPGVNAQDLAHLERVARRAAAAMQASFPAKRSSSPPTLADALGVRS